MQVPFNIKSKQKWTPKETHQRVSIFIDLPENDIDALMKQRTQNLLGN